MQIGKISISSLVEIRSLTRQPDDLANYWTSTNVCGSLENDSKQTRQAGNNLSAAFCSSPQRVNYECGFFKILFQITLKIVIGAFQGGRKIDKSKSSFPVYSQLSRQLAPVCSRVLQRLRFIDFFPSPTSCLCSNQGTVE